jgi:gamma-glutamyl hercynylcysteine S-oxide synthase
MPKVTAMPPAFDVTPQVTDGADAARRATNDALATALQASRADTLRTLADFEAALPQLQVPLHDSLNPPLWELGHIGWFQDHWTTRNPQRWQGTRADPFVQRLASARANANALYDSSSVPHATRWALPLPSAQATRADLLQQLQNCLAWLADTPPDDASLYFHRLVLFHEDMHHEAALHAAQSLGLKITNPRWQAQALASVNQQLTFDETVLQIGHPAIGFAFDNELPAHTVHTAHLPATQIDSQVLRWAEYLPFVEDGGYQQPQWWTDAGRDWLVSDGPQSPRYTRREDRDAWVWQHQVYGRWQPLDLHLPACHLTAFEAEAWCRWAGRRLPTETEWERAAVQRPRDFTWGQVWEWTASDFGPYPGFVAHPYRDYSAPWFGQRRVLRGGSFMTQPRIRHPHYRNFFMPQRNDVPAGFRTCSV